MSTDAIKRTYEAPKLNQTLRDILHPGGLELTDRSAQVAGINEHASILDVGSGRGASLLYLVEKYGCRGRGVDFSPLSVSIAEERCLASGLGKAQFTVADAGELPFADGEFDVVLSECTLSLLPQKPTAIREMARVVKPGGRTVISDVVLKRKLSDPFKQELGFVCCFTEALTLDEYKQHFLDAGLDLLMMEDHSIELKKIAYRVSVGYGSLQEFWSQFGQGEIPCCNPGSASNDSGCGWKELFRQGRPGYWLMAWIKPDS